MKSDKEKFPDFVVKTFETNFCPGFRPCNPSARLKNFCLPVMIIKIENNFKSEENLATILVINIFRTISLSQETIQYPYFKL